MRLLLLLTVCITSTVPTAFASTDGSIKEVVSNEKMQIYVYNLKEGPWGPNDPTKKQVDIELVVKNSEPSARVFNLFFVRLLDNLGQEYRANPLQSTILPVRIAPNDILNGRFTFVMPDDVIPTTLIWEEPDSSKITVDLTRIKDPEDPVLKSDWILTPNKGRKFSDGRSELVIHDELMSISPRIYIVEISIKNISNEIIRYSPSYAFAKDDKGRLYPIDLQNIGALKNPLLSGELKPGERVRGTLLFSLLDDADKAMFIYDEDIGLGSYFVAPEFPIIALILVSSIAVVILTRFNEVTGTKISRNIAI
ncbi:MAG: DUF4352 domain-containing protein [Nitrososphaerales archaeon]